MFVRKSNGALDYKFVYYYIVCLSLTLAYTGTVYWKLNNAIYFTFGKCAHAVNYYCITFYFCSLCPPIR